MSGILLVDNARHLLKEAVKVINTIEQNISKKAMQKISEALECEGL